jgi:hypothetical protein
MSVRVTNALHTNEWYHLAAVSGPGGMKLFFDGAVIATTNYAGSFSAIIKSGARFRLGRSVVDAEPFVDAQLAEVRVWKVARSEAQIRQTMFMELTGNEPHLAGLWNFEDNTANDSSPGGHHGKLVGGAKVIAASVPAPAELAPGPASPAKRQTLRNCRQWHHRSGRGQRCGTGAGDDEHDW